MKYSNNQNKTFVDMKTSLIREFKKLKSESQQITQLKEIKQKHIKSIWEFDKRFKVLLSHVRFDIVP